MYVGSLGIYIGAELLVLHIWGTVVNTVSCFLKWLYHLHSHLAGCEFQ